MPYLVDQNLFWGIRHYCDISGLFHILTEHDILLKICENKKKSRKKNIL